MQFGEEFLHVLAQGLVVVVEWGPGGWFAATVWGSDSSQDGGDDVVAEDGEGGHGARRLGWDMVAAGAPGFDDEVLCSEFS